MVGLTIIFDKNIFDTQQSQAKESWDSTCEVNKLTSVFLGVCPVIDHEFRHNIVKVVCGSTSGSADYFDNVMTKFMINNRTDALKTDVHLCFTITTGQNDQA